MSGHFVYRLARAKADSREEKRNGDDILADHLSAFLMRIAFC